MSNLSLSKKELPSSKFKRKSTVFLIALSIFLFLSYLLNFNPILLIQDFDQIIDMATEMLPPRISVVWSRPRILSSLAETFAMSFLGSIIGCGFAFLLALLSAKTTAPLKWLSPIIKFFLSIERVVPSLIILLFFLIAVGLGPFAATLAIAMGTIGTFGKLFKDNLEQIEKGQIDGLKLTGASHLQVIRYAIIPQATPSLVSNAFYAFDVNMRRAVALGIFGGGGIGYELHIFMKTLNYKSAMGIIVLIIVLIALLEKISDFLRQTIIGKE